MDGREGACSCSTMKLTCTYLPSQAHCVEEQFLNVIDLYVCNGGGHSRIGIEHHHIMQVSAIKLDLLFKKGEMGMEKERAT